MSQFERSKKPTKTEKYSEDIKHQKWSQIFDSKFVSEKISSLVQFMSII